MNTSLVMKDCFACHCVKGVYQCKCLTKMLCKLYGYCPFYKSKNLISYKEIEKSIKNYSI